MPEMKKDSSNILIYLFGKTWKYAHGWHSKITAFWMMFICAEAVELFITPFLWAQIMNVIQIGGITEKTIWHVCGLLLLTLGVDIAFWVIHGPARVLECFTAFHVRMNYREYLLKGVMTLPLQWHSDHHSGDTIDKVEKGTRGLYEFSSGSFQIIYALVRIIGCYCVLTYFSHSAGFIVLAMVLLTAWIIMRFDRILVAQYTQLNKLENKISESVFDAISNITTVIVLRVERLVFDAIMEKVKKPYQIYQHNTILNEIKWFLVNMCCTIMTIAVLSIYFWHNVLVHKNIMIGDVYLLIKYLENISNLFFQFAQLYGETLRRKAQVLNAEELSKSFSEESFTNHVLPARWQELHVESLSFSYHQTQEENLHLENISLFLLRGQRVAFVGTSGSGKTTCLKVLRELYKPTTLTLTVDGILIPEGFGGIARAISLVPQDSELFATTILENITLGADYDIEFVKIFTDMACFTDVVMGLPNQFSSSIKEKGVNLSGGQKQRLALSRGLLACHDKDICLLDEPTSSLDAITEMRIYQNIFQAFEGKLIISSVHKLHLLPLFDVIYLFDEGRIIAHGSLNQLLVHCSQFQELWQQQREEKAK